MKQLVSIGIALGLALGAQTASAELRAEFEGAPETYLRDVTLPIAPGIQLVEVPLIVGTGVQVAQDEGPDTSLIPPPRPGQVTLSDGTEPPAPRVPAPAPPEGEGNLAVVASSDGAILRPRPRPTDEIARILEGVRAGATPVVAADAIELSVVTADTVIPRPRPARLSRPPEPQPTAADVASDATDTPNAVSAQATGVSTNMALDRISLIGVFGTDTARRALLRMPDGSRIRVAAGSRVSGWSVVAVDPRSLRMIRDGEVRLLELP
ncbi:hypothetical protein [Pontivivens insulae]|uniref:Type II secretion system protein GspC N-terminal domain-containing protein n=1 Tax=Pontivivens insulae TaxID=1639689 RepID=A0A2R8A8T0_9RHOB|nr:hypothetical protein [Pontivivens insulae]RED18739.1 hypothetical protein DFR53_0938 [Pontivivens insulae]SPF28637.1 hypothetical protein POI8812_00939 [Pontivivens insulae]